MLLSDCSGMRELFLLEENVIHVVRRWQAELLQFHFFIVHWSSIILM